MEITSEDIVQFIKSNQLSGKVLCLHTSLKALGTVIGGANTIIDAFLSENCTIMSPTHSWWQYLYLGKNNISFNKPFKPFTEKAWKYSDNNQHQTDDHIFNINSKAIDKEMGALPKAILNHPESIRSNNPISSFTAIGTMASEIMSNQAHFYSPVENFIKLQGKIVLLGVDVNKITLIHYLKQKAGHNMLLRWVIDKNNEPRWLAGGGCSDGFMVFNEVLQSITQSATLGNANCKILNSNEVDKLISSFLQAKPLNFPTCSNENCELCNEAKINHFPVNEDNYYVIEHGDYLWKIAEELDFPFELLQEIYPASRPLIPGRILKLAN